MGRPTKYTKEIGDIICAAIADRRPLARICKENNMLPGCSTVFRWLREHEEFRENYEISMALRADYFAEEIAEIADNGKNDWMEINDPDNRGYKHNGEHIQRSRLRVDARKWLSSKYDPKKYGDRLNQEVKATHTGANGGPIVHKVVYE